MGLNGNGDPPKILTLNVSAAGTYTFSDWTGLTALSMRNLGDHVSIDNFTVLPVPEPASWTMMIGGLALAGAAMRRRSAAIGLA